MAIHSSWEWKNVFENFTEEDLLQSMIPMSYLCVNAGVPIHTENSALIKPSQEYGRILLSEQR